MLRTSIFPSRYVQGAGALDSLDAQLARLGTHAACLVDSNVTALLEPSLSKAERVKLAVRSVDAACTERSVAAAAARIRESGADIVVSFEHDSTTKF